MVNKFKEDHNPRHFKQVLIKKASEDISRATEGNATGFLGYCPQENALWSNLTVREHLEIYAAVKGIRKDAAAVAIHRYEDDSQENYGILRMKSLTFTLPNLLS